MARGLALVASLVLGVATLATAHLAGMAVHLAVYATASLAWLVLFTATRGWRPTGNTARLALALGAMLHIAALASAPLHSDDVYRYLWDGAVQRADINPYLLSPDDPRLTDIAPSLRDRINNRSLPTVYPPAAQLAFLASASLPMEPLTSWKLLVGLADVSTAAMLSFVGGPTAALLWLLSPTVLIEVGVNAHVDALAIAWLLGALLALRRHRPGLAGALLGLSAATKLLPMYLLASLRARRTWLAALLVVTAVTLPYVEVGTRVLGSLGEYGRRWRGNDGAFGLIHAAARGAVWIAGKRSAEDATYLGPIAHLVTGRDRTVAYPDELAGGLARLVVLCLFCAALLCVHRRAVAERASEAERALRITGAGVLAFLLLTPVLHPWYALWALPVLALDGRSTRITWASAWLLATAPLGYVPLPEYLVTGLWHEPLWPRLIAHAPALAIVVLGAPAVLASSWAARRLDRKDADPPPQETNPCAPLSPS